MCIVVAWPSGSGAGHYDDISSDPSNRWDPPDPSCPFWLIARVVIQHLSATDQEVAVLSSARRTDRTEKVFVTSSSNATKKDTSCKIHMHEWHQNKGIATLIFCGSCTGATSAIKWAAMQIPSNLGQTIIFHQPRFPRNKGSHFP